MHTKKRQATVCFLHQAKHLLLAHIEYSPDKRYWTGIGGFVEDDETREEALVREVTEETHLLFSQERLQKVGELHLDFVLHIFLTDYFTGQIKAKDPSILDLLWFPVTDLPYPFMHPGTRDWLEPILEGKYIRVSGGQIIEVREFIQ